MADTLIILWNAVTARRKKNSTARQGVHSKRRDGVNGVSHARLNKPQSRSSRRDMFVAITRARKK